MTQGWHTWSDSARCWCGRSHPYSVHIAPISVDECIARRTLPGRVTRWARAFELRPGVLFTSVLRAKDERAVTHPGVLDGMFMRGMDPRAAESRALEATR